MEDDLGRRDGTSESSNSSSSSSTGISPETHILIELLREQDFYHASPNLRGERQRARGRVLHAERSAGIRVLQRFGWNMCSLPEHEWNFLTAGKSDPGAASELNQALIFRHVAKIGSESG